MTNRQAVISDVGVDVYTEDQITKALINVSLDETATYTVANKTLVAEAALEVLKILQSIKSVSEGGYNLTLQIEKRISDLEKYLGLEVIVEVAKPSITAVNVW